MGYTRYFWKSFPVLNTQNMEMKSTTGRISIAIALICIALSANAQSPDFPNMTKIESSFMQTEVTITDVIQQVTGLAKEYFDNTLRRGKVDLLVLGERTSIHYSNDTGELLHVNSTTCMSYESAIADDSYFPLFYGWLNREPLIIGPSAPLWYAQDHRSEIIPLGPETIRDIDCYKYSLDISGKRDNITIFYWFAVDQWVTPYQMKEFSKIPIRIQIEGISSKYSEKADQWASYNLITDFAYFKPTITDWQVFQPQVGLGCHLKEPTKPFPELPKVFMFDAEVVDLKKAEDEEITDVEHHTIWYDYERKIARLDRYTKRNYVSELYDFNMGVTYTNTNWETCKIKPLRNSFFEGYDGKLTGHMKWPKEVLGFDSEFYHLGQKLIRGIWTDVFETLKEDVVYRGESYKKLVVTVYYSQDFYKVNVNGEIEGQVPVFYIVSGWKTATNMTMQLQYNIFGFDDVIWPEMYQTFGIGRCFPLMETKSYFLMIVDSPPELSAKMEESDELIREEIRGEIARYANVTDMRIPLLNIDYTSTGVFITGLILDRPPATAQFWWEFTGDVPIDYAHLKMAIDADTNEKCAYACVEEGDNCIGFYMCKKGCFLKSTDLLDPSGDETKESTFGEVCDTYMRSTQDSWNNQKYLGDALAQLEEAVLGGPFKLEIVYMKDKQQQELIIPISQIVIGDGPYIGDNNQEKAYKQVMKFAQLKKDVSTSQDVPDTASLNDCYQACKDSESMTCASFSYCPEADNKQCRISSVLAVDKKTNLDDIDEVAECLVYSRKYLEFYEEYPGRILPTAGEDSFEGMKSVEECAKKCRETTTFTCRGFDYCRSRKSCTLHSKHVLDLKPTDVKETSTCVHYAAKFAADYYDKGFDLIQDDSDKRTELSLEECARVCSEELKGNCNSFNYCPASGQGWSDSTCSLSTKVLPQQKTDKKDKCRHYEKKSIVDDWGKSNDKSLATVGYTAKGFTGLVIGMLALGLVLGAMGFVGYSYFRSKSSGEGMTVRFMKSDI
ncbi:hypothetical protein JTE90_027529 [Oedothorax gibbosus]|uniref:Apple domain-containing protein n=1 Tax=Oedothorax gibbosus TaxID=931172 RepID=A0AAV6VKW0_9ARAC|nr:hypothetical protein JTE90_027529 [Oedothorax gibbosus]